jgi:hypothetical protein
MDIPVAEKKKKKSKKEKKEEDEIEEVVVSDVSVETNKKKDKKNKKKKNKDNTEEETVTETPSNEGGKDKKKKKRKEAEASEENDDISQESEPKKKVKSTHGSGSNAAPTGNYVIHPDVARMTSDAVDSLRQEMDMVVIPEDAADAFKPMTSFAQLYPSLDNHCPEVRRYIDSKGFTKPSPIQVFDNNVCTNFL